MSLKEELEERIARQTEEKKPEAYYRRLWEEAHLKPDEYASAEHLYQATLPVFVTPEFHALVKEFIELCPDKAWKRVPEQVDREAVLRSCKWTQRMPSSPYELRAHYEISGFIKVRLSDGSIHRAGCKLGGFMGCLLGERDKLIGFHPFGIGALSAAKRAEKTEGGRFAEKLQKELDQWKDIREGTQDYLVFSFSSDSAEAIIFRDGTVFALPLNGRETLSPGNEYFVKKCFLDFLSRC